MSADQVVEAAASTLVIACTVGHDDTVRDVLSRAHQAVDDAVERAIAEATRALAQDELEAEADAQAARNDRRVPPYVPES